jgi:hypothetical protein
VNVAAGRLRYQIDRRGGGAGRKTPRLLRLHDDSDVVGRLCVPATVFCCGSHTLIRRHLAPHVHRFRRRLSA